MSSKKNLFKNLPDNHKTRKSCFDAINEKGFNLRYVPDNLKSISLCHEAVRKDALSIQFVPEELKTRELCIRSAFSYFSDKYNEYCHFPRIKEIDFEFNERQYFESRILLKYIPDEFKNEILSILKRLYKVDISLEEKEIHYDILKYKRLEDLPVELRTEKIYRTAVKYEGYILEYVPINYRTTELCIIAMMDDGKYLNSIFEYIPDEQKTFDLCLISIIRSGDLLKYIPDRLMNSDLCTVAVRTNPYALKYVPEILKTKDLCLIAAQGFHHYYIEDNSIIEYVPEGLHDCYKEELKYLRGE